MLMPKSDRKVLRRLTITDLMAKIKLSLNSLRYINFEIKMSNIANSRKNADFGFGISDSGSGSDHVKENKSKFSEVP